MTMAMDDDEACRYIGRYFEEHGFPPSYREMAAHFGLSLSRVHDRLAALTKNGRITRAPHHPRTIRVVMQDRCPTCGRTS